MDKPLTTRPLIIGISGKKRSGKDTLCEALLPLLKDAGLRPQRRALADALKDEAADALWPSFRRQGMVWADVRELFDDCTVKEDFRGLLQWWGTGFRRNMFGDDYWLEVMAAWIGANTVSSKDVVVVPDVRFPGETDWVHSLGGVVIRVECPARPAGDQHVSETALDDYKQFDAVIVNDAGLEGVKRKAKALMPALLSVNKQVDCLLIF